MNSDSTVPRRLRSFPFRGTARFAEVREVSQPGRDPEQSLGHHGRAMDSQVAVAVAVFFQRAQLEHTGTTLGFPKIPKVPKEMFVGLMMPQFVILGLMMPSISVTTWTFDVVIWDLFAVC